MKTVICVVMTVLMCTGVAVAKSAMVPITPENVKDLKGEWAGERHTKGLQLKTELTIANDQVPLKGELRFFDTELEKEHRVPFTNGRIEDGRLVVHWGDDTWINLELHKTGDRLRLEGEYLWQQRLKGSGSLYLEKQ